MRTEQHPVGFLAILLGIRLMLLIHQLAPTPPPPTAADEFIARARLGVGDMPPGWFLRFRNDDNRVPHGEGKSYDFGSRLVPDLLPVKVAQYSWCSRVWKRRGPITPARSRHLRW